MGITELAEIVRRGIAEDERIAREACGGTVVGEAGNWRQAPGGDEWEAEQGEGGEVELLVALRPGLPRPSDVMGGYWGAVVSQEVDYSEPGVTGPLDAFRHAARHDPARVLAEVASKRRLLDEALAWEHHHWPNVSRCEATIPGVTVCRCGRDARVLAILTHLAAPYQETT